MIADTVDSYDFTVENAPHLLEKVVRMPYQLEGDSIETIKQAQEFNEKLSGYLDFLEPFSISFSKNRQFKQLDDPEILEFVQKLKLAMTSLALQSSNMSRECCKKAPPGYKSGLENLTGRVNNALTLIVNTLDSVVPDTFHHYVGLDELFGMTETLENDTGHLVSNFESFGEFEKFMSS